MTLKRASYDHWRRLSDAPEMTYIEPFESSSTKLAVTISGILGITLVMVSNQIYSLMNGTPVNPLFSIAILALMACTSIGLFIVSFYVTKRINAIAATAHKIITTRDLSQRIPIDARWDDLSKLASALNLMLEDIEQLVTGMRQVSDNIAHDLRTPLTRLRNHLELLRTHSRESFRPDYLNTLIAECDGLLGTFNALLRIANIEAGKHQSTFAPLSLGALVEDVVELYEPVAADKNISLVCYHTTTTITGDKDMLFQAIANLVDNAIKYTPEGGTITITIAPDGKGGRISVADTGTGVPDGHKHLVFRRFYRVDGSRHQSGSGLGLSLVAAVVRLHHGNVTLTDNKPTGLVVTVTL